MADVKNLPKEFDLKKIMTTFLHNNDSTKGVGMQGFLTFYRGTLINYPMSLAVPDFDKFQAYPEDVVICGTVKSGASRICALVGMIMHDANPEWFYNGPDLQEKVPWLEFCTGLGTQGPRGLEQVGLIPPPRAYWTRVTYDGLPPSVLEQKAKIVYHMRHPKDQVVTLYHHYISRKSFTRYEGTLSEVVEYCVTDNISTGPWFDHYAAAWARRNESNVLMCSFEDFSEKPYEAIKRLGLFLDRDLTDGQIAQVAHDTHFDQMSNNPHSNHTKNAAVGEADFKIAKIMRSGVVGGWKKHLSQEDNAKINAWMAKNLARPELKGLAEQFPSTFLMEDLP